MVPFLEADVAEDRVSRATQDAGRVILSPRMKLEGKGARYGAPGAQFHLGTHECLNHLRSLTTV